MATTSSRSTTTRSSCSSSPAFADRWFVDRRRPRGQQGKLRHVRQPQAVGRRLCRAVHATARFSSLKVFGNIGKGIKSPTLRGAVRRRLRRSVARPEGRARADRRLGAELRSLDQRLRASVTYFNNDYMTRLPIRFGPAGDGIPEYINIDGSDADGWELEAALQRPCSWHHRVRQLLVRGYPRRDGAQHEPAVSARSAAAASADDTRERCAAAYAAGRVTVHFDVRVRWRSPRQQLPVLARPCRTRRAAAGVHDGHHRQSRLCRRRARRGRASGSRADGRSSAATTSATPNTTARSDIRVCRARSWWGLSSTSDVCDCGRISVGALRRGR